MTNFIQQANDGSYIIAGGSTSNDGDVTDNHGNNDCWIVKLTPSGEIDWQKTFGGSNDESAFSIRQTTDGGYITSGESVSGDGDIPGNKGAFDAWIIKLDAN